MSRTSIKGRYFCFKNINFKILTYIQIFILVKAAFSLEGIQRSRLIMKNEQRKQARYFDETSEKLLEVPYELCNKF